jgi:hypothetical protein
MNLKKEIDNIKIIDNHCHVMDPFYWKDAVGTPPPFPPHIHGLDIPTSETHLSKTKKLIYMFQTLYGFPYSTITEENKKELQAMYDKTKDREAEVYHKVMDLAGIEMAFLMAFSRPILPPSADPKRFRHVGFTDGFIIPLDNTELKKPLKKSELFVSLAETYAQNMKKELNWYPSSFDDYLKFLSAVIEKLHEQGAVAFKANSGYWRNLDFEWVSEEEARSVFESQDIGPERYKRLQDYLQKFIFIKCGELGLPFHMHSGAGGQEGFMRGNDPSLLDKILWHPELMNTKVIILHGGFPYCREAGYMCASFGQRPRPLYLDTSIMWMDHPTPGASSVKHILREWLEIGLSSRLIYGSDATSPFKLWMSAMNFRDDLYIVLKDMVYDGLITEGQAVSMAYKILRGNAETIYKW